MRVGGAGASDICFIRAGFRHRRARRLPAGFMMRRINPVCPLS
jgi:hypothetical protein